MYVTTSALAASEATAGSQKKVSRDEGEANLISAALSDRASELRIMYSVAKVAWGVSDSQTSITPFDFTFLSSFFRLRICLVFPNELSVRAARARYNISRSVQCTYSNCVFGQDSGTESSELHCTGVSFASATTRRSSAVGAAPNNKKQENFWPKDEEDLRKAAEDDALDLKRETAIVRNWPRSSHHSHESHNST